MNLMARYIDPSETPADSSGDAVGDDDEQSEDVPPIPDF